VIKSRRDSDTRCVFERERVRRWSEPLQRAALRKLLILDAATKLRVLAVPPDNRMEKLSGGRSGQHSIRINEIVHGQRSITADTARRLARYCDTSDLFWINLQTRYDLEMQKDRLGTRLDKEVVRRSG
jgi:toxin HigB-1